MALLPKKQLEAEKRELQRCKKCGIKMEPLIYDFVIRCPKCDFKMTRIEYENCLREIILTNR